MYLGGCDSILTALHAESSHLYSAFVWSLPQLKTLSAVHTTCNWHRTSCDVTSLRISAVNWFSNIQVAHSSLSSNTMMNVKSTTSLRSTSFGRLLTLDPQLMADTRTQYRRHGSRSRMTTDWFVVRTVWITSPYMGHKWGNEWWQIGLKKGQLAPTWHN